MTKISRVLIKSTNNINNKSWLSPSIKEGCSHVKSDYAHTIIKHTPLSPYTRNLRFGFQQLRPFYILPQPHHVTASHPSPGNNHQSTGGQSERTKGDAKGNRVKLNHLHMHQDSPLLHIFRALSRSLLRHPSAKSSKMKQIINKNTRIFENKDNILCQVSAHHHKISSRKILVVQWIVSWPFPQNRQTRQASYDLGS